MAHKDLPAQWETDRKLLFYDKLLASKLQEVTHVEKMIGEMERMIWNYSDAAYVMVCKVKRFFRGLVATVL